MHACLTLSGAGQSQVVNMRGNIHQHDSSATLTRVQTISTPHSCSIHSFLTLILRTQLRTSSSVSGHISCSGDLELPVDERLSMRGQMRPTSSCLISIRYPYHVILAAVEAFLERRGNFLGRQKRGVVVQEAERTSARPGRLHFARVAVSVR